MDNSLKQAINCNGLINTASTNDVLQMRDIGNMQIGSHHIRETIPNDLTLKKEKRIEIKKPIIDVRRKSSSTIGVEENVKQAEETGCMRKHENNS